MKRVCVTNQKGTKTFPLQWDSILKKTLSFSALKFYFTCNYSQLIQTFDIISCRCHSKQWRNRRIKLSLAYVCVHTGYGGSGPFPDPCSVCQAYFRVILSNCYIFDYSGEFSC